MKKITNDQIFRKLCADMTVIYIKITVWLWERDGKKRDSGSAFKC